MTDFLTICQNVTRESGTVSGTQPQTVAGQTGRLLKIVEYVKQAWEQIQTNQSSWKWMRRDFTNTIDDPSQIYTPASLSITDFRLWDTKSELYIFATADGKGSEGQCLFCEWRDFRSFFLQGIIQSQNPPYYTVRPTDSALYFSTVPDQEYTINGEYFKNNQVLVADNDVPECPSQYHIAIQWLALQMLNTHDEAYDAAALAGEKYNNVYNGLCIDQLETIRINSDPIA